MNRNNLIPSELPIHQVMDQLLEQLNQHDACILQAPPGAGKTTTVPLALSGQRWLQQKKILMLEPRRLAARAAAERMAQLLGEKSGETVGYRVRHDSKIGPKTVIEVVTEGVLNRLLLDDPSLSAYGLVIFDEFHERSLDADLGLSLTIEGRALFREADEPLKLLVMSATLQGEELAALLDNAPIIKSEGRSFPVKVNYFPYQQYIALEQQIAKLVRQAIAEQPGSILVFLPGQREITKTQLILQQEIEQKDLKIYPLYGNLPLEAQQKAIAPSPDCRKIVLTTNIAETSLTIEGISVVIDSGFAREAEYDNRTGMTRLHTRRISQASAKQRAGRAGRLAPGVCYRLWSEGQQEQLRPFTEPEISKTDLAPMLLQLLSWGAEGVDDLCWLTPPAAGAISKAEHLLHELGAIAENGVLTKHGEMMARMPLHPRFSHMLLSSVDSGKQMLAAQVAALLSGRDPVNSHSAAIAYRLDWLSDKNAGNKAARQEIIKQTNLYLKTLPKLNNETNTVNTDEEIIGLLIALSYPDRIAKQRSNGSPHYQLSNGRSAHLKDNDPLSQHQWLAVAQTFTSGSDHRNDQISLAAPLNIAFLEQSLPQLIAVEQITNWDSQKQKIIAEKQYKIGKLVLRRETSDQIDSADITSVWINLIRQQGLNILPWSKQIDQWRQRVIFLHQQQPDQWPDLSDQTLLANLEDWLAPYLDNIHNLNGLKRVDLNNILLAQLPWPKPQQLEQLAPERIKVPSGSRIRLDYSENPPVLAVKLQEMFGCTDTPRVAGDVAVKIHLLSPAGRPLQVTQDLASFWSNSYQDVKKEMKGRYPKHPWPDDPLEAIATGKTKRHL